ncbi:MAG: hypothetical protein AB8H86_13260 [Polyangiales bacterium]
MKLDRYRPDPPFWFPHDLEELVVYKDGGGGLTTLMQSSNIHSMFRLNEGSALGCDGGCVHGSESAQARRMAIWDLRTGERLKEIQGFHLGPVLGASVLDDGRLLTWGRDYLVRSWDLNTGAPLDAQPLPLVPPHDERGLTRLSASSFGELSPSEQHRYVDERHLAAPDIELYSMWEPGDPQIKRGAYKGNHLETHRFNPFDWSRLSKPRDQAEMVNLVEDMRGAEAGYSSVHRMRDERALLGGTTYGTSGIVYVWDGCFDLTLLFLGRASINFTIEGEHSPGHLRMSEYGHCYEFDVSRS